MKTLCIKGLSDESKKRVQYTTKSVETKNKATCPSG